jgi:hypothetical protein
MSLTTRNNFDPAGTTKMNKAINICRPIPQMITLQFIFFLSADRIHAKPIRTNIPAKLTRL